MAERWSDERVIPAAQCVELNVKREVEESDAVPVIGEMAVWEGEIRRGGIIVDWSDKT